MVNRFRFSICDLQFTIHFSYGRLVHRKLQSQTSASAEPFVTQHRHTADCCVAAAILFQLALGACALHHRLDIAVCGTRYRRKSTCLLQEPCLSLRWTNVVVAAGRILRWLEQSETFKVAVD